tara:strand:+ start:1326 stop:2411 length:1086 start_codon:yes stop_codon:yes gene_type:complete
MMIKKYQNYLIAKYLKSFLIISLVFFSIIVIVSVFEEINFFENKNAGLFYPLLLTFLNAPSILIEVFPFIFILSVQFLYIHLSDNYEIEFLRQNGINNSKILIILSSVSFAVGLVILLMFYSVSSSLKSEYLDIKNKFTDSNDYLAIVNDSGLWIKEERENTVFFVHAKKFENEFLEKLTISFIKNKNFSKTDIILAEKADISNKKWKLSGVKIIDGNNIINEKEKYIYESSFNSEIISGLFSNLNSLNVYQLFKLKENYSKIDYSTTEVVLHLNKLFSMPIFYILMTILSFILIIKLKLFQSKFFTIIAGISCSVLVYYLNYFSYIFGSNETLPILFSVWLPHLLLSLFCLIGILGLNEN